MSEDMNLLTDISASYSFSLLIRRHCTLTLNILATLLGIVVSIVNNFFVINKFT